MEWLRKKTKVWSSKLFHKSELTLRKTRTSLPVHRSFTNRNECDGLESFSPCKKKKKQSKNKALDRNRKQIAVISLSKLNSNSQFKHMTFMYQYHTYRAMLIIYTAMLYPHKSQLPLSLMDQLVERHTDRGQASNPVHSGLLELVTTSVRGCHISNFGDSTYLIKFALGLRNLTSS